MFYRHPWPLAAQEGLPIVVFLANRILFLIFLILKKSPYELTNFSFFCFLHELSFPKKISFNVERGINWRTGLCVTVIHRAAYPKN